MRNSPKTRAKPIRRTVIGALLGTVILGASASAAVPSVDTDGNWLAGCPGTMVMANVDCGVGTSALLSSGEGVGLVTSSDPGPVVFAPWCDGQIDTARYGCPVPGTGTFAVFTPVG
jgi:hypothetical protein